ncbi:MAG: hypothetical protein KF752_05950 [Pirellulaceae bacterium]|nr:hypothetical protein [Pirellulaceae bacterium]
MAAESKNLSQRLAKAIHVIPGGVLLFALIPLVICGYLGWYHYGAKKLDQALYALQLPQITLTAQPEWITGSVLDEVYRSKRLDKVNLLEPSASATIASAFETHPWVEKTSRVEKTQGGAVSVDVVYRRPLAMVKVVYYPVDEQGKRSPTPQEGFFPVDYKGVILPDAGFKQNQSLVRDYLLIDIDNLEHPSAQPGMPFNDIRVAEALKLVSYLEKNSDPKHLGIQWVHVRSDSRLTSLNPWLLELWSVDKHLVIWGHAPGQEGAGEESAERKLAKATTWLQTQRSTSASHSTLDLINVQASNNLPVSTKNN